MPRLFFIFLAGIAFLGIQPLQAEDAG
ncbi:MAG: hypothetical protein RLZZ582_1787, partial [Verrucomicrobiota bacterium]